MSRIIFPQGEQSKWLSSLLVNKSIAKLASVCDVSIRTIRDWKREKYTISEKALLALCKKYNVSFPKNIKYASDFWYTLKGARMGALKRFEMYGQLGTSEGRKKGGKISQQRRRKNPEKYRSLGCNVRKLFKPLKYSKDLAELMGIILGDGGVTDYQLRITLDGKKDREYAKYIQGLMLKVFGDSPAWNEYKIDNTIDLCISGINLIESLDNFGIKKGNKISRQIDFPLWIWKNKEYQTACVKGLIDTDGGIYFHKHWTNGTRYRSLGLCFTSHSTPLLNSVSKVLSNLQLKHSVTKYNIFIYRIETIERYFKMIGSNNPKNKERLYYHVSHSRILGKVL